MFKIVCLSLVLALVAAEEPCTCDQINNDIEQLRLFLAKPSLETTAYPVVPGELSPAVCNCDNNRKKRSKSEQKKYNGDMQKPNKVVRSKCQTHSMFGNNNKLCAVGYRRYGMFCLPC